MIRCLFNLRSADVILEDLPANEYWQNESTQRSTKHASELPRVLIIFRQNPVLLFVRQIVDYEQLFCNCRYSVFSALEKTKAIAFRSLSFDVDTALCLGELLEERTRVFEDLIAGSSLFIRLALLLVEKVTILLLVKVLKGMLWMQIYFGARFGFTCFGAVD